MLFAGLGGFLVLVSGLGYLLQQHLSPARSNSIVDNINARIKAWWAMVILMAFAFLGGKAGIVTLFAFCSFLALREFVTLTNTRRADHWPLALAFFVVLPFQYYLIWIDWYGFYSVFIPVYAFLLMPIIANLRGDTGNFLVRVAETQWALMISVFCVSHVPALLSLDIPGFEARNERLIVFLVIVAQSSNVLEEVLSKLYGRTKIAPRLSPARTVEGFIGGALGAACLGACLSWITPFTFMQAGLLSLIIATAGLFGSLVMSAIKRDRGVKDWGHMIPGHGGFIDQFDAVIFSAPLFFHLVRYGWSLT